MKNTKKKKVLIINGGGIFGIIPAHFLSMVQTEDLKKIDMISGCSIGGILAAAYASGKSFAEIDTVFQERAEDCFKKRWQAKINPLSCPTYRNDSIDSVIQEMIGNTTVAETRGIYPGLDVIIPALNITEDKYKVFDNITGQDDEIKLADIAGYTSAAPSYYSGREFDGSCIIDGGLIEVAPLLTATTAMKSKRNIPFMNMDVLMIGTGEEKNDGSMTVKKYNGLTILGIATDILVPYVTKSNKMATTYWGKNIGYNSFEFFDPCIISGDMDDVSLIPELVKSCDSYADIFVETWEKFLKD